METLHSEKKKNLVTFLIPGGQFISQSNYFTVARPPYRDNQNLIFF